MKKLATAAAVIAVVVMAGSAMAYGGRHYGGGPRGWEGYPGDGHHYWQQGGGPRYAPAPGEPRGPGPRDFRSERGPNIEIPQEIRDKITEARKLQIDLHAELDKRPLDKAKATEIYKKHRALRNEISEWFFLQRLDDLEKRPAEPKQ